MQRRLQTLSIIVWAASENPGAAHTASHVDQPKNERYSSSVSS